MKPPSIETDGRYAQKTEHASAFWHLDGVPWWDVPLPRRWHRHWIQSVAWIPDWTGDVQAEVQRCGCGGLRILDGLYDGWTHRNSRRGGRS